MSFYLNADELFEVGLEIERNGRRFYELAAEQVQEDDVRTLCRDLARWEDQHVSAFEVLRRELPNAAREDAAFDPESEEASYVKAMAGSHVFLQDYSVETLLEGCTTAESILDLALSFEKDSVLFYGAIKPMVPPEHGRDGIDALIREEMSHIVMLTAWKKRLQP